MSIAGEWYNDLGSLLSVTVPADAPGELHGFYVSRVGDVIGTYPLVGVLGDAGRPSSASQGVPVGWCVAWHNERRNAYSVTSWNGQYREDLEQILVSWLLTRSTGAEGQWDATVVGHDVFRRDKPDADELDHARRRSRLVVPHPVEG